MIYYKVTLKLPAKPEPDFKEFPSYELAMRYAMDVCFTFCKYAGCDASVMPKPDSGLATFILSKGNYPDRVIDVTSHVDTERRCM